MSGSIKKKDNGFDAAMAGIEKGVKGWAEPRLIPKCERKEKGWKRREGEGFWFRMSSFVHLLIRMTCVGVCSVRFLIYQHFFSESSVLQDGCCKGAKDPYYMDISASQCK